MKDFCDTLIKKVYQLIIFNLFVTPAPVDYVDIMHEKCYNKPIKGK